MKSYITAALALVITGSGVATAADPGPDIVIADFEGDTYGAWKVEGNAFGDAPARGTLAGQQPVTGFAGKGLVNTFHGGDGATGTLTSPELTIERPFLNLLVGGGAHEGKTCVDLLVGEQVVRTATGTGTTGADDEHLSWRTWDVRDLLGKKARIRIVDAHTGGWGHVNVDQIVESSERKMPEYANEAITLAMASLTGASARAAADPTRPRCHFLPPALWQNDPNGPIEHGGSYHLFYQLNPYGDRWEHMHWGHARSKDLIHWEHLPIALWPSVEKGEEHCFSGCAALDGAGKPVLLYTSIHKGKGAGDYAEQWAAVPEGDDLLRWRKHPANPVLDLKLHGELTVRDWRDPFVFHHGGNAYLVCGGNVREDRQYGAVQLYRAESADLTRWKHLGVLFKHPDPRVQNIECPNFFPLGGKWVLIISPHGPVQCFTGDLDLASWKFTPSWRGVLDPGSIYAPSCFDDSKGRKLMWGWINGFQGGHGWNGCMTLPRVLSIAPDGSLRQQPAAEVSALRGEAALSSTFELEDTTRRLEAFEGDQYEVQCDLELGDARQAGVKLRASGDGTRAVTVSWDGRELDVAGTRAQLTLAPREPLRLRIFLDHSVLEVHAAGRAFVTRVVYPEARDLGLAVFASGGTAKVRAIEVWRLKGIW